MINEKILECPICNTPNFTSISGYEKDHLVRCNQCYFVFSELKPTKEELDNVYQYYDYSSKEITYHTIKKINKLAVKLMKLLDIKNVLDIACGDGKHLIKFKNLGCNCYGTEYDSRLEKLGQVKGINMISGGIFPSKPYENISFDLVIFTEIIEHINNPRKVLMNIHYLLNKDGILYITTPNFNCIERKVLGKNWGMICYPEHISYYSPKTLHKLLTQCGFEKIYLYTENISIFRIVQYMQRRKVKKDKRLSPESISARAQNLFSGNILGNGLKALINNFLNITGTGVSIVAIYRKIEGKF